MKAQATRVLVAAVASLAVVVDAFLLFVKPHQQSAAAGQSTSGTTASSGSAGTNSSASGDAATVGELKDGTYTSVASPNAYGAIQLEVTVKNGKITAVTTLQAPNEGRSQSINAQALPELTSRAISAQSADIQFISGATETSTAFVNSLQDAINQSINAGQ